MLNWIFGWLRRPPTNVDRRPQRPPAPTLASALGFTPSNEQAMAYIRLGGTAMSSYELDGVEGPVPLDVPDTTGCGLRFMDLSGRNVVVTPDGGIFVLNQTREPGEPMLWAVPPSRSKARRQR
ncbi:MAG: hypothetical protein ABIZ50_01095 [Solirubrobacterales bacterium]